MGELRTFYQQIADHVKKNISKGYTSESIKYSLMSQGYSRTSVEKAIALANKQLAEEIPQLVEKPVITRKVLGVDELDTIKENVEQEEKGFFYRLKQGFKNLFS